MDGDNQKPSGKEPPEHSRFKDGESGNPSGRPKGSRNMKTIIRSVAERQITFQDGSKTTLLVQLIAKLRSVAAEGNVTASEYLQHLIAKLEPPEPKKGVGVLIVPPPLPPHISPIDYALWLSQQPIEKPKSLYDDHQ